MASMTWRKIFICAGPYPKCAARNQRYFGLYRPFLPDATGNFTVKNDLRPSVKRNWYQGLANRGHAIWRDQRRGWISVSGQNEGIDIMFGMMNHARLAVGLQGLAIADRAYQQALFYARDRVQGVPLDRKKVTLLSIIQTFCAPSA